MARGMGELLETKAPRVPFPFFPYSMMMMVTMMVVVMMQVNTTFFRCDGSDSWAHCKLICFIFIALLSLGTFIDLLFSSFSLSGPGALCS